MNLNFFKVVYEVSANVVVTQGHEGPESMFRRHVHQQNGSYWALGLAIANLGLIHCKCLQYVEKISLSGASAFGKKFVHGKLPM